MNTSKNISLIDQDFKDITAITPSKRNTSSEGGMLKTGEVLGKARLGRACASGCCRPESFNLSPLGKPKGPEEAKAQSPVNSGKPRAVVKEASSEVGSQ